VDQRLTTTIEILTKLEPGGREREDGELAGVTDKKEKDET